MITTTYQKIKTFKTVLKTLLIFLTLTLIGNQSFSQSNLKLTIQDADTVLILTKPQAVIISNSLLKKREYQVRLEASLTRENKLIELWNATTTLNTEQTKLIGNLEWQLELAKEMYEATDSQLKLTEKTMKKGKRKSLLTGLLIGSVAGVIGGVVLMN